MTIVLEGVSIITHVNKLLRALRLRLFSVERSVHTQSGIYKGTSPRQVLERFSRGDQRNRALAAALTITSSAGIGSTTRNTVTSSSASTTSAAGTTSIDTTSATSTTGAATVLQVPVVLPVLLVLALLALLGTAVVVLVLLALLALLALLVLL